MYVQQKSDNKVIDYFCNPRNCGETNQPDAIGISSTDDNRIIIKISVKITNEKIEKIKFKTLGCATSIASAMTELVKRKKISEALTLSKYDISEFLGKIPEEKIYCCQLAINALHNAIQNYLKNEMR
jgi:nitrogen fixation NifU-like protein